MSTPKPRKKIRLNPFKKKQREAKPSEPEPFITASQVQDMIHLARLNAPPYPRQGIDPFVIGFTLGMIAGGVAAGLLTPGKQQLHQQVNDQSRALREQAENIALQAKTTAQQVLKR